MKYFSTRSRREGIDFSQAVAMGLAADGGLLVPELLPRLDLAGKGPGVQFATVAEQVLSPFLAEDALAGALPAIIAEAFDFPLQIDPIPDTQAQLLALYHGPTAAFKDFGARFLAACLGRMADLDGRSFTLLVATSGDTGGAVAAAVDRVAGLRAVILYPDGRVSPRQARQLCAWGDSVVTCRVQGSFDDCQGMVKRAFQNQALCRRFHLSSANSINIGRLLPQVAYHYWAALRVAELDHGPVHFIVPTGNLGNALACIWARAMGAPIGRIVMACNANRSVPDYFRSGRFQARPSVATVANAMDVGDPSNMERLLHFDPAAAAMGDLSALSFSDAEIRAAISAAWRQYELALCPHTATAWLAHERLDPAQRAQPWVLVATAHPAKFERVVEPLLGAALAVPDGLQQLLQSKGDAEPLAAGDAALVRLLQERLHG